MSNQQKAVIDPNVKFITNYERCVIVKEDLYKYGDVRTKAGGYLNIPPVFIADNKKPITFKQFFK